ncbi:MAG: hypothetical protein MZV64_54720 [Ignavibacteriales bacterium]|nr:hypothetical protein [Ignavibacteriales bacterium]
MKYYKKLSSKYANELEYYHFTKGNLAGIDMIIFQNRLHWRTWLRTCILRVMYLQAEKVWEEVFKAGKEFDIQPVGLSCT